MSQIGTSSPVVSGTSPVSRLRGLRLWLNPRTLLFFLPLVVIVVWGTVRITGLSTMSIYSPLTLIILAVAIFALVMEFTRSADIVLKTFKLDLLLALLTLKAQTGFAVAIWILRRDFSIVDAVLMLIVFWDAYICTVNSFKSALRNVQAGVNTDAHDSN